MNYKYTRIFVLVFLAVFLFGCGKSAASDVTQITSKSLSATAELSDYQISDGSFSASVTIKDAQSLRYLADDEVSVGDWREQFDPYLVLADGSQLKLAIGDVTVNQKGSDSVVILMELSVYIPEDDLTDPMDMEIQIKEFDENFQLYSLKAA